MKVCYGTFTAESLQSHLEKKLPADFEILMVHSSIDHLYPMFQGQISSILKIFLDLCAPDRTLVMPAFYFGDRGYDPAGYYRKNPRFDARRTPSMMGLMTEAFRRSPGVRRSLHPTHSICALGPLAEELVSQHHLCGSRFGQGSPFAVMAQRKTAILGLGTYYFQSLTQIHAVEDLLGEEFPVRRQFESVEVALADGNGSQQPYLLEIPVIDYPRRSERLGALLGPERLREWSYHGVPMYLVAAAEVTQVLCEAARRGLTIYETPRPSAAASASEVT